MPKDHIKNTAIIYTGYDYQTLFGLSLLADWLEAPTLYEKILFEAEKDTKSTPQGLDDVICQYIGGKRDFYQVKFTPNTDNNLLDFDWLLTRSGKTDRSRSILQKSFDSYRKIPSKMRNRCAIITNKRPDDEFERCLDNGKILFARLSTERQHQINEQLGNASLLQDFLAQFEIIHSYKNHESLERHVLEKLRSLSNETSARRLLAKGKTWSIIKNEPHPDGWITFAELQKTISTKRPDPITQNFKIPHNYCLPDTSFHNELLNQINEAKDRLITVVGSPGSGKSTYLSYLTKQLKSQSIPVIRHHYFLSLDDHTSDRMSLRIVVDSLFDQLKRQCPSHTPHDIDTPQKPSDLFNLLLTVAENLISRAAPLVVIVDGLDHVWRDNESDATPLHDLFSGLLPLPENLVLILGTQPVEDKQLPKQLLKYSSRETWYHLPFMSPNAVLKYLKSQLAENRLTLHSAPSHHDETLHESALCMHKTTSGYPLLVIYSCETLIAQNLPATSWNIEKLPRCNGTDITSYYQELWRTLTNQQKAILTLCCGLNFLWPQQAFESIVAKNYSSSGFNGVMHLLYETICGYRPFHESLILFISSQSSYEDTIAEYLPSLCNWLERSASSLLKDSWLWICQAMKGDSLPLREGISRDWALDKISSGLPIASIHKMLTTAEDIAFKGHCFGEAFSHRALKTRLINGPEYQCYDFAALSEATLSLTSPEKQDYYLSTIDTFSPKEIASLASALWLQGQQDAAHELAVLAIENYHLQKELYTEQNQQAHLAEITAIVRAATLTESFNFKELYENKFIDQWSEDLFSAFLTSCKKSYNVELLQETHDNLSKKSYRKKILSALIPLCALEQCEIEPWIIKNYPTAPFIKLKNYTSQQSNIKSEIKILMAPESAYQTERYKLLISYSDLFFEAIASCFSATGSFSWLPIWDDPQKPHKANHYDIVIQLATDISESFSSGIPSFYDLIEPIAMIPTPKSHEWDLRTDFSYLNKELYLAITTLYLTIHQSEIPKKDISKVASLENFNLSAFISWYADLELACLTSEAAEFLVTTHHNRYFSEPQDTAACIEELLLLINICLRHGLTKHAQSYLRLCWDFTLGYGNHKDYFSLHLLDAIDSISGFDTTYAIKCINKIESEILNITEYTDGDGTRHAISRYTDLLAQLNEKKLAEWYEKLILTGEWDRADECLESILTHFNYDIPVLESLSKTGLSDEQIRCLEKKEGNIDRKSKLSQLALQQRGKTALELEERSPDIELKKSSINFADYSPENVTELLAVLTYSDSETIQDWYSYWAQYGKKKELVNSIMPILLAPDHKRDLVNYLFEQVFEDCKKLFGKKKAFPIIVQDHIQNMGWSDLAFRESHEQSKRRLKTVAQLYPSRVFEFIEETTIPSRDTWDKEQLIIPSEKLVFFLLEIGEIDHAQNIIDAMITTFKNETRNIKLEASLSKQSLAHDNYSIYQFLITRFHWPVPTIKWWTALELAKLLCQSEAVSEIESLLLNNLEKQRLEAQCIEILSIFWIAWSQGYTPSTNIGDSIKARSLLSDLLVDEIQPEVQVYGQDSFDCPKFFDLPFENKGFQKALGTEIPMWFKTRLEHLQERSGMPFTLMFEDNWNKTFEYGPKGYHDINYFLNSNRDKTGMFYTLGSQRGRSAYLRTLTCAVEKAGMPIELGYDNAITALPFEPTLVTTKSHLPSWLPSLKTEGLLSQEYFKNYLKLTIGSCTRATNSLLGALTFSINVSKLHVVTITCCCATDSHSEISTTWFDQFYGNSEGVKLTQELSYSLNLKKFKQDSYQALVGSVFPWNRFGHWHADLPNPNINVPLPRSEELQVTSYNKENSVAFSLDNDDIGSFGYWHSNWEPSRLQVMPSYYGTYTLLEPSKLKKWLGSDRDNSLVHLCKIEIFTREYAHEDFNSQEILFKI